MKRKVTKESFQGKKENLGSLSPPRNNPLITLLMGMGVSVYNRDCIGHKRVTATAPRGNAFPWVCSPRLPPNATHQPSLPLRGEVDVAEATDEVLWLHHLHLGCKSFHATPVGA